MNLYYLQLCTLRKKYDLVSFFFNDTATTEIYTLSLHDALPISDIADLEAMRAVCTGIDTVVHLAADPNMEARCRSEEHTSELQSRQYLVCRLLLEKKKKMQTQHLDTRHSCK